LEERISVDWTSKVELRLNIYSRLGMVVHAYNPSTQKAEARGLRV
jgi:hypothetical protein